MLELRGLSVSYGPVDAVRGVDLDVGAAEIVALVGPNGAGKTSTLRAISGPPTSRSTPRTASTGPYDTESPRSSSIYVSPPPVTSSARI